VFHGAGTVLSCQSIRPGIHRFIWDILLFTVDIIIFPIVTVTDSAMVIHHTIMPGLHIIPIPIGVIMVITDTTLPYVAARFHTIPATGVDREAI
jgi:hypothetical protein